MYKYSYNPVILISVILSILTIPTSSGATSNMISIVSHSKSGFMIAIPVNAKVPEKTAANELSTYIKKSTGVQLKIVTESTVNKKAIYIGNTRFAKQNKVVVKSPEAWRIKTVDNNIILTGGSPRGTLYAVFHFLEDIVGVRWWNPWEESVPSRKTLSIGQLDMAGKPSFEYRDIYDGEIKHHSPNYVRNRLNGHFAAKKVTGYGGGFNYGPPYHVHTAGHYLPASEYFDKHPEYFSLIKGIRVPNGNLCLTNKEMISLLIEKVKANIRTSYAEADAQSVPRPVMFSISQNDCPYACECDSCSSVANKSGQSGLNITFVNAIAEAVGKEFPEVRIDTLAYWQLIDPPKGVVPAKNVSIRFAYMNRDILHNMLHKNNTEGLNQLKEWVRITPILNIWDYCVIYPGNAPLASAFNMPEDYRLYKSLKVRGIFSEFECPISSDFWDMNTWIYAKMLEDPSKNIDKLIKTFTDGYYGQAGKYIRQYLQLVRTCTNNSMEKGEFGQDTTLLKYLNTDTVLKAEALFNKGLKAVEGNAVFTRRIEHARTALDRFIVLRYSRLAATDKAFPIARDTAIKRLVDSLNAQIELRHAQNWDTLTDPAASQIKKYLKLAESGETQLLPLPEELKNLPEGSYTQLTSDAFTLTPGAGFKLVSDKDSPVKQVAIVSKDETGINWDRFEVSIEKNKALTVGIYDKNSRWTQMFKIETKDIAADKYKLYCFPNLQIEPDSYLFFFDSWELQCDVSSAIAEDKNARYDLYISAKFEGPSVAGDPTKTDAIYVDRIIIHRK